MSDYFKLTETQAFGGVEGGMSLALASFDARTPDVDYHKSRIIAAMEAAENAGADMLVLPEAALSGMFWDGEGAGDYLASTSLDAQMDWLSCVVAPKLGGKLKYLAINGYVRNKSQGQPYRNVTCLVSRGFSCIDDTNSYTKLFLPQPEPDWIEGGSNQRLVVELPWGRFGFLTCFDLCFQQLVQEYVFIDNVDAIIVPAAWRSRPQALIQRPDVPPRPWTGLWNLSLASYSALYHVWMIGCNTRGIHPVRGDEYAGNSMVYSPFGACVAKADNIEDELMIIHGLTIKETRRAAHELINHGDYFKELFARTPGEDCFQRKQHA